MREGIEIEYWEEGKVGQHAIEYHYKKGQFIFVKCFFSDQSIMQECSHKNHNEHGVKIDFSYTPLRNEVIESIHEFDNGNKLVLFRKNNKTFMSKFYKPHGLFYQHPMKNKTQHGALLRIDY